MTGGRNDRPLNGVWFEFKRYEVFTPLLNFGQLYRTQTPMPLERRQLLHFALQLSYLHRRQTC